MKAVRMHDLGAEHRAVPLHQLSEATRSSHYVGQALWHDGPLAIEASFDLQFLCIPAKKTFFARRERPCRKAGFLLRTVLNVSRDGGRDAACCR